MELDFKKMNEELQKESRHINAVKISPSPHDTRQQKQKRMFKTERGKKKEDEKQKRALQSAYNRKLQFL